MGRRRGRIESDSKIKCDSNITFENPLSYSRDGVHRLWSGVLSSYHPRWGVVCTQYKKSRELGQLRARANLWCSCPLPWQAHSGPHVAAPSDQGTCKPPSFISLARIQSVQATSRLPVGTPKAAALSAQNMPWFFLETIPFPLAPVSPGHTGDRGLLRNECPCTVALTLM